MTLLVTKVTLLLLTAIGLAHVLRRGPAATTHRLWTTAFVAVLLLPLCIQVLPPLRVPVPAGWLPAASDTAPSVVRARWAIASSDAHVVVFANRVRPGADRGSSRSATTRADTLQGAAIPTPGATAGWPLALVWLAGAAAAVAAMTLSVLRARRLAHAAEEVTDPAWLAAAAALCARIGLRRAVRIVRSPAIGTPMAGGLWRPVVFLPAEARDWSPERRDVVLAHEIVHLAGGDALRHLIARLALAVYWFHPLAWVAAGRAAAARESACDEAVIALGIRRSTYARVLLELAACATRSPVTAGALPAAGRGHLERRLMTILNGEHRPVRLSAKALTAVTAGLLLSVAAIQPRAEAQPPRPASAAAPAAASFVSNPPLLPNPAALARQTTAATRVQSAVPCPWTGSSGTSIQWVFGDLSVCFRVDDTPDMRGSRPSELFESAGRLVLETRQGATVLRMQVERPSPGAARVVWQVNGANRPVDAAAETWRARLLEVLDTTWAIATLRGDVASLRGRIASIRGERASLQGQVASVRGQVASMRGEIASLRGQDASMRGEIASVRGQLAALQGAVSAARGAIASLNATPYSARVAPESIGVRIAEHEATIARLQKEIDAFDVDARVRAIEREREAQNADARTADVEARIRAFAENARVADLERRITALDVDGQVGNVEQQIRSLDADRRVAELEARRANEVARLRAAMADVR